MTHILNRSIFEIAELYRSKELSPVEVMDAVFDRIEDLEDGLNAFVTLLKKEAYADAKTAEGIFQTGATPHLLTGIPYSIKDLFYTKDILTTCASNVLKDFKPSYSATVVEKLHTTGAVCFGKNNMLEFAYGIVHPDFGQTNNPWDLHRTSGGSSSGSVAAVASGIGYFSLGTDTGGSIRIPASYCGVVGVKPTYGLVSTHGVFPLSWSLDHAGPITRTVKEAAVVLDVISGPDRNDPHSANHVLEQLDIATFNMGKQKWRIGILPKEKLMNLTNEVKKVYDDTIKVMDKLGFELVEVQIDNWNKTEAMIMNVLLAEAAKIHQKWLGFKDKYAPVTYQQIEAGMKQSAVHYLNGKEDQASYRATVNKLFENVDFLFTPTVAFPAPKEDPVIGDEELDEMMFTGPFNLSGHPAVTVNMGYTGDNLPVGIQIVGKHFCDLDVLKMAYQLEQTHSLKMPPLIENGGIT